MADMKKVYDDITIINLYTYSAFKDPTFFLPLNIRAKFTPYCKVYSELYASP